MRKPGDVLFSFDRGVSVFELSKLKTPEERGMATLTHKIGERSRETGEEIWWWFIPEKVGKRLLDVLDELYGCSDEWKPCTDQTSTDTSKS